MAFDKIGDVCSISNNRKRESVVPGDSRTSSLTVLGVLRAIGGIRERNNIVRTGKPMRNVHHTRQALFDGFAVSQIKK